MYLLVSSHLGGGLEGLFFFKVTWYFVVLYHLTLWHLTSIAWQAIGELCLSPLVKIPILSVLYWSYLDCRISYIMYFLGNTQNSQSSMLKQWRLFLCITSWWMRTQCIPCMQSYKTNSITCRHLAFLALRYVCKL